MDYSVIGRCAVLLVACGANLAICDTGRACFLFDCFRKKSPPVTAYFAPTATPATTAPATGGCCGAAVCEQTVLRYVPQVSYRTVWEPVPVTTYRRTVSSNPATGLPITCTQPCSTYTYQARRVPYTTFRPVYTTEPLTTTPVAAPVQTVAPAVTTPLSTSDCGCNSSGTGWSTVPSTAAPTYSPAPTGTAPGFTSPSYTTPGYTAPASPAPGYTPAPATGAEPAGATPWEPVTPGASSAPAGSSYGTAPAAGGSGDPASERPRIPPSIDPNLNRSGSVNEPAPSGNVSPSSIVYGGNGSNTGPSASTPWTTVRPEIKEPPAAVSTPATRSFDSGSDWSASESYGSPAPYTPAAPYTVRPLPKLDPPPADQDADAPPLLNDPRDRTAVRPIPAQPVPVRWASRRIEWPEQPARYEQRISTGSVPQPSTSIPGDARRLDPHRLQLKRFDSDSQSSAPQGTNGWRSAARP